MSDDLFPDCKQDSPRLAWMKRYGVNPKDMTNEVLLDVWLKEMKGDYEHGCPCETEVNRRLDEADALRKENDALKLRIAELQSMLDTLGGSD